MWTEVEPLPEARYLFAVCVSDTDVKENDRLALFSKSMSNDGTTSTIKDDVASQLRKLFKNTLYMLLCGCKPTQQ